MQFALAPSGQRVQAVKTTEAVCPQCRTRVIAKCGRIVVHHWAHEARECDPWWEPETAWHRAWKARMPLELTEVTRAGHRADLVRFNGQVVELQHSPISPQEIEEREQAYKYMAWLFDGVGLTPDVFNVRDRGSYHTFRWKHPRKTYGTCRSPVFIHLPASAPFTVWRPNGETVYGERPERVFQLKALRLRDGPPYGGWGYEWSLERFGRWLTEL